VPINQAVNILPQLKTSGRVSRGFMGVLLTDVTPPLQRALGLTVSRGALVQDFTAESSAERAGVRVYDVIVEADGADIGSNDELIRTISAKQPGAVVKLEVSRDGKRLSVPVRLTERPQPSRDDQDALPGSSTPERPAAPQVPLGLSVRDLDASYAARLDIPPSVRGVIVNRVDPTGAVFSAAMRRGLILTEINRRPIRTVADYQRIIASAEPGDVLALMYYDPTIGQRALATVTVER
jgi:serine protease Do